MKHKELIDFLASDNESIRSQLIDLDNDSSSILGVDLFVAFKTKFKRKGYFVEFGASDGVNLSNTYTLEKNLEWNGLLVEPAKVFHDALKSNRKCNIDFSCIGPTTGQKVYFMEEDFEHRHYSHVFGYPGSKSFNYADKYVLETVSLDDILDRYNAPSIIDFVSIDTKGGELEILEGFDFSKRQVNIFCIDWSYTHSKNGIVIRNIKDLLTKHGYKHIDVLGNHEAWFVYGV